jgi:LCP family protein required for cell wall assembly
VALTPASKRAFLGRYAIAFVVIFVLVVGGIVTGTVAFDQGISGIKRQSASNLAPEGPGQAGNFLIIGSDSRAELTDPNVALHFGDPRTQTGQQADVIMVVHVQPDQKRGYLVSIPRDTYVQVPGEGRSLINSAYNDGAKGPERLIQTLKDNFNIPIQHYIKVNFDAFKAVVDAIGTVPVTFATPARDTYSGLQVPAGCVELNGTQALAFVRSRHFEIPDSHGGWYQPTGSDIDRIQRQQNFIRQLASIAVAKSGNNFLDAWHIADAVLPKLTADTQLSTDDVKQLINTFRKVDPNDPNSIQMVTLPTVPDGAHLRPKQPDADAVIAPLLNWSSATPSSSVPSVSPSQVRVRVLNGSQKTGAAAAALAGLVHSGFLSGGSANAPSQVNDTVVSYRPGNAAKAALVASYLRGIGSPVVDSTIKGADVVVTISAHFAGVHPPAAAATAPAPAPAKSSSKKSKTPATPHC